MNDHIFLVLYIGRRETNEGDKVEIPERNDFAEK